MPDSFSTWLGMNAHLEKRVDDALGNRVVAAAGAQRRLAAAVGLHFEADPIGLLGGDDGIAVTVVTPRPRRSGRLRARLPTSSATFNPS